MNLIKTLLFFSFSLLIVFNCLSQYTGNEKKYTIQKIEVLGSKRFSRNTILSYTNLKEGMKIIVPGDRIRESIKKLWSTGLFKQVNIYAPKIQGDKIWLELQLIELSKISDIIITGIKKRKNKEIIDENNLEKDKTYITDNLLITTKNKIEKKYKEKGFLGARAKVYVKEDTSKENSILAIDIDRGKRIKISQINFKGNKMLRTGRLRARMKNTKQKNFFRVWKSSKFNKEKYLEDLKSVIDKYKQLGFRDAQIISDTTYMNEKGQLMINIEIKEGKPYYFRNIDWVGNSVYSTDDLNMILGYTKGDPYDVVGFQNRLSGDERNRDIHTLYLDKGYLFSNINFIEKTIKEDSVDVEIQIKEDVQARINQVNITGNERTNDHVIYREIRTKPGDLFSKTQLQRTYREVAQLGFFDAEKIKLEPKPNYQTKMVDIDIGLEEVSSSQLTLSGAYGGNRLIGSLGFSFNNFSLRKLFDKEAWSPIPTGDGQKLAVNARGSTRYQSYDISFTEPWLGGVRPNSFSFSVYYNRYSYRSSIDEELKDRKLNILGISLGLGKRLSWPDDFFYLRQSINLKRYTLNNYPIGAFNFENGFSNNINYALNFGRNSSGPNPIYPTVGSDFDFEIKLTPPYSLLGDRGYEQFLNASAQAAQQDLEQARLKWLEFYRFKFRSNWYKSLAKNLVLNLGAEFGILGAYNNRKGVPPFERFYIGGTNPTYSIFDERDLIKLRGYEDPSTNGGERGRDITPQGGGVLYNKFLIELRYPITLNPVASIYILGFLEAGGAYDGFKNFQPFELKRSAGFGVRLFMPMIGLIGVDFGYGFDPVIGETSPSKRWIPHFSIGQNF